MAFVGEAEEITPEHDAVLNWALSATGRQ
jgi:hypothetical protein